MVETHGPKDQIDGNTLGIYRQKSAWVLDLLLNEMVKLL